MNADSDIRDFRALFLAGTPMLDVRAPVEFSAGAFPGTVNIPLLTDDERAQVGTAYKQQGQQAAIALGHQLVGGSVKAARVADWLAFTQKHPDGCLYCFRGGLRSQTVRSWLRDAGVDYPLVVGGYKAMRQFLIGEIAQQSRHARIAIVGGRTGSGKTRAVNAIQHSVDLEALARHRGSSFGRMPGGQPTQIDFENALAIALLRATAHRHEYLWLEDESRLIGRCAIPLEFRPRMEAAPIALIEEPMASRIQVVLEDYVIDALSQYRQVHGVDGGALYAENLLSSLDRVEKRLGGLAHRQARTMMQEALDAQLTRGEVELHRSWIEFLLERYYDPMYDWQLKQKRGDVLFRGSRNEVVEWINKKEGN